jgi:hypothetical protein
MTIVNSVGPFIDHEVFRFRAASVLAGLLAAILRGGFAASCLAPAVCATLRLSASIKLMT